MGWNALQAVWILSGLAGCVAAYDCSIGSLLLK